MFLNVLRRPGRMIVAINLLQFLCGDLAVRNDMLNHCLRALGGNGTTQGQKAFRNCLFRHRSSSEEIHLFTEF